MSRKFNNCFTDKLEFPLRTCFDCSMHDDDWAYLLEKLDWKLDNNFDEFIEWELICIYD